MTKVVIAMSGGVDSSVAAALLKQQGYEVIGMMLRLWSEPGKEESNRCCTPDSMAQARRVACLVCNRSIRWEFLLNHALALGADFMATGHYARKMKDESGKMKLLRAVDPSKDQSYVLHVLTQEKLRRALFPVGDYPKTEIRQIAESFGLPTASRADSQDLCFLAGDDYRNFIQRNAPQINHSGDVVTGDGKIIGQHSGLANYTIGQRKGLGLSSPVPLYVITKHALRNTLVVGIEEELGSTELTARDVNWLSGDAPSGPFRAEVKIRYTARAVPAEVTPLENGTRAQVKFDASARDVTAGQAAVFYVGEEVLGGGIIV
jgi:tRNA-specific 2-thiouridylase